MQLTGSGLDGQMQGSQRQTYSHSSCKQQQSACFLGTALSRLNLTSSCRRLDPSLDTLAANMGDDEIASVGVLNCLAVFVVVVSGASTSEVLAAVCGDGILDADCI